MPKASTELDALRMSHGFRQAARSRRTLPATSDRDDDDDPKVPMNASAGKRSTVRRASSRNGLAVSASQGSPLKRSFSSLTLGSSANGKDENEGGRPRTRQSTQAGGGGGSEVAGSVTATPTKPKQKQSQGILFVSGDARPKTTPRRAAGRRSAVGPPSARANGAASEGKSRNKGKDREDDEEMVMETPTRQRTRPGAPNGSSVKGRRKSEHKRERSVEIEVDENRDEDYPQASGSRSRTAPKPKKKVVALQLDEDEDDDLEDEPPQDPPADEDNNEGMEEGATDDEARSTASSEDPIASPTKRTPSKQKAKAGAAAANQSVLEVPGFITQTSFDVYFQQTSIPARTSARTFTLELPTLSSQEYWDHLASTAGIKHETELLRLRESHVGFFPRYMMELQAGFNLLFYGFGSKRETLNHFARQSCAKKGDVVVLNGYRPGVRIKELLDQVDGLRGDAGASDSVINPSTASLSAIELQAQRIYNHYIPSQSRNDPKAARRPLFIVVHNIDSTGLRNQKSKAILALLASNPRIHLIGSIDHMNAPLIWKQSEAIGRGHHAPSPQATSEHAAVTSAERAFAWLWHDLTTFEHYDVELRASGKDLTSLTVSGSGKPKLGAAVGGTGGGPAAAAGPLTEAGAHQVLSSVTERSRKIFILLANRQLADVDAEAVVADSPSRRANVTGAQMNRHALSYESLFSLAREGFIATSDQALRGLLQEFKDHGMVMMGASNTGGGEMIWIPLARNVLEKLIDSTGDD